ncbi:MAG: YicC/YloC family endoribonuclease [Gammaproteobacteria bacterium]
MIHSMTGFARCELQSEIGNLIWEIRTVNHRYLEINLRVPEQFRSFEPMIRESLSKHVHRGKLEANLVFNPSPNATQIQINHPLVQQLMQAGQKILDLGHPVHPLRVVDLLSWPGVVQTAEVDKYLLQDAVLNLLNDTLVSLVEERKREGNSLKQFLEQRLNGMEEQLSKIRERLPLINQQLQRRLAQKFSQLKIDCEAARLEQEVVLSLQKMDVSEELDRLSTHLEEAKKTLSMSGLHGRRLDFLSQELTREANTLGAKSIDAEMTNVVVELKVLIDQLREQVQNIE